MTKSKGKPAPKQRLKTKHKDTRMGFIAIFVNDLSRHIYVESFTEFLPRKGELIRMGPMHPATPYHRVLEVIHVIERTESTSPNANEGEMHAPVVYLSPYEESLAWEDV